MQLHAVVALSKRLPFRKKGAHEGRRLWRKQAVVSPVRQGELQTSSRVSEAAKRLELRGHGAKRSPQGRNTAQALAQGGANVWDDHAELRNSAKRSAAPEYRASEAQAGTKTPVRQGKPRVSLRTSEARRAEVASTRSEAQCAATEHRASEAQSGAKTRSDHAELRGGRLASGSVARRLLRIEERSSAK